MRHRLWVTLIALGALAAACYPGFDFTPKKSHHGSTSASSSVGAGGAGGAVDPSTSSAGGAGGTTADTTAETTGSTTSSSTSGGGPTLPCGPNAAPCEPGDVCCVHESDPALDHCGSSCGAGFYTYTCHLDADCPDGKTCCGADTNGDFTADTMQCAPSCAYNNACANDDDCDPLLHCQGFFDVPGYQSCQ